MFHFQTKSITFVTIYSKCTQRGKYSYRQVAGNLSTEWYINKNSNNL